MVSQMLWWPLRHHSQLPSPTLNGTRTRSPRRQRVTPGPTSSITPQNSWPRTCGSGSWRPIQLQSPIHRCQSLRQMPFASTRTTTPFSGGVGSGTSRTTSGWRMPSMTAALIGTLLGCAWHTPDARRPSRHSAPTFRSEALTLHRLGTSVGSMARPALSRLDEGTFPVPASVRFPVELTPPDGFDPARLETWPRVEGRLEWVAGRLLYMPPCGELQSLTVTDLVGTLSGWGRSHPECAVGTNEAGMLLRDDVRAADAAVLRRADMGPVRPGVWRVPPLLAAEVAGRDEGEEALREKARWYLEMGVLVAWILLP